MKVCGRCKESKTFSEFNVNSKKSGYQSYCKKCQKVSKAEWHQNNKDKTQASSKKRRDDNISRVVEYLSSHPCVDCGNSDPRVLEFDHKDRLTKFRAVSMMLHFSWSKLLEEIEKCEVRCANCHRIRTREQLGWMTR